MLRQPDPMDTTEPPLQLPPAEQDSDMFSWRWSLRPSFRIQHLETYFLSDLFNAACTDDSEFVRKQRLATVCRNKELFFTGNRLDQWNLDVLLYCVQHSPISNGTPERCQIDPAVLLRAQNRRNSKKNRERVFSSLQRLSSCGISIQGDGYQYTTRLLDRVLVDARREQCLVEVNGDVAVTFRKNGLERMARERLQLGNDGLAKWLHGAIQVFKGGFAADLESLYGLCRPRTRQRRQFVGNLEKALEQLQGNGILTWWEMDDRIVRAAASPMPMLGIACGLLFRCEEAQSPSPGRLFPAPSQRAVAHKAAGVSADSVFFFRPAHERG